MGQYLAFMAILAVAIGVYVPVFRRGQPLPAT
jgi:hypothetical protein